MREKHSHTPFILSKKEWKQKAIIQKILYLVVDIGNGIDFLDPIILGKAILVAVASSFVTGAIPGGGYVGELLIASLFGLPPESLPIMILLGTVLDAPITAINATGQVGVSMVISKVMYGKEWLKQEAEAA